MSIKRMKSSSDFEPSMRTLSRIVTAISEHGSKCRTKLSLDTNLNYSRLARHVVWLEKKGLVESKVDGSKINIALTGKGEVLASVFSED